MGGRDEGGWNVLSSVLGKLDNPVSFTSLIRRGGKNSPVAISTWSTLALMMWCYRRGRGRVRRAEHLTSTWLTWDLCLEDTREDRLHFLRAHLFSAPYLTVSPIPVKKAGEACSITG